MSIKLQTVGIVVNDMEKTLAFYRLLGLDIPPGAEVEPNVDFTTPDGLVLGFISRELAEQSDPDFNPTEGGQRINLQFMTESPSEVNSIYEKLMAAGYQSYAEPWDAFWGQRFARVTDPDGKIVNIYAQL